MVDKTQAAQMVPGRAAFYGTEIAIAARQPSGARIAERRRLCHACAGASVGHETAVQGIRHVVREARREERPARNVTGIETDDGGALL